MNHIYPHNQQAVTAILRHYSSGFNKAAIVHATGTGKSYIIAGVAQNFLRPLIVAPNKFVLAETEKVCHTSCQFITYQALIYTESFQPDQYDFIVFDEFHRAGADQWGASVKRLLAANKSALLLGTSATHIRYLDSARNMADELFDSHIVSTLSLSSAIQQNILPNPTYVSSIYRIDDTISTYNKKISRCNKKSVDKDLLLRKLSTLSNMWHNAGGVPALLRKYISHDMKRIIVFCSSVNNARHIVGMLKQWFSQAGFQRVKFYNFNYTESSLPAIMQRFQAPLENGVSLKVAVSINMLNEGVHVPNVQAVIMMRSTISRIIVQQQIGRCLSAGNNSITPVVLDLVNNLDADRFLSSSVSFSADGGGGRTANNDFYDFPFSIIDECKDFYDVINSINQQVDHYPAGYWTFERCREEALKHSKLIDWIKNGLGSYHAAVVNGWSEELSSHMSKIKKRTIHTKEECIASALKYKIKAEWIKADMNLYSFAYRHNWIDECCAHMTNYVPFSKEDVINSAKQFKHISDWSHAYNRHYGYARTHGFLAECCAHMVPKPRKHKTASQS